MNEKQIEVGSDEVDVSLEPQTQPENIPGTVESELTQKYKKIMGSDILTPSHLSDLIRKMEKQHKISYEPHYFHQIINVKIIEHMPNYQIVTLEVAYGYFKCLLTVYCQQTESHSHILSNKGNHQSSSVFMVKTKTERMVIKCYATQDIQDKINIFQEALKQYFLFRIAQGLGVGPKLMKIGGFDMIISEKCVEFGLEKCSEIIYITKQLTEQMIQNLVLKLRILHAFHLVHVDIKPQNLMYSKLSSQLVFIDFGFSKLIKEKMGFKSRTSFAGSIGFCGHQMKAIVKSKILYHFIDLYYNDAHALNQSLEILRQYAKQGEGVFALMNQDMDSQNSIYDQIHLNAKIKQFENQMGILKLKYLINFKEETLFQQLKINKTLNYKSKKRLIQFILVFPYSLFLDKAFQEISKSIKDKRHITDYIRRIEFKKSKIFKELNPQIDTSILRKKKNRLQISLGIQIKQNESDITLTGSKFHIYLKQNLNAKLLNEIQIQKMSHLQYALLVTKVIDLRSSLSSLDQKIKISQLFLEKNHLQSNIWVVSLVPDLEKCFKVLLQMFTTSLYEKLVETVPLIVENLVIMEALSIDEIIQIIQKGVKIPKHPIKTGLFLFHIIDFFFWTEQKIITKYKIKQKHQILTKVNNHFWKLIQSYPKQDTLPLIHQVLLNFYGFGYDQYPKQIDIRSAFSFLKKNEYVSNKSRQQILSFLIKIQNRKQKQKLPINVFLDLHQYGGVNLNEMDTLDTTHLQFIRRIFKDFNLNEKPRNNYQKIIQILSDAKLIYQFEFYYLRFVKNQAQIYKPEKVIQGCFEDLFLLIQIFQANNIKQINSSLITKILGLHIKMMEQDNLQVKQNFQEMLRQFLSGNNLKIIEKQLQLQHIQPYLGEDLISLCILFYKLFPVGHSEIENFKNFFQMFKIQSFTNKCNNCKFSAYTIIRKIQCLIARFQNNFQTVFQICQHQIYNLLDSPEITQQKYSVIQFLQDMVLSMISNDTLSNKYSHAFYSLIKQNDLEEIVTVQACGNHFFTTLNEHALFVTQSIEQFVSFHFKLLQNICKRPHDKTFDFYNRRLKIFLKYYGPMIKYKASAIVKKSHRKIRKQNIHNPYFCIFMDSFLIYQLKINLLRKLVVQLCRWVDLVSSHIRMKTMKELVQFIYQKTVIVKQGRSKRRKIMMFANYLNKPGNLNQFSRKTRWKQIQKGQKNDVMFKQQKRFYENLA